MQTKRQFITTTTNGTHVYAWKTGFLDTVRIDYCNEDGTLICKSSYLLTSEELLKIYLQAAQVLGIKIDNEVIK